MADNLDSGMYVQWILSMLLKKIIVPADFHSQVRVVKDIQKDDVSGLVDSLTDFAVNAASVNYEIKTDSDALNSILTQWLDEINIEYNGKIPIGINALAEEYYKERWKYSSFPVLKIAGWREINGFVVPSRLFFVDGESIHAKDINEKSNSLKLINYDYYLGKTMNEKSKLENGVIFTRPYGRWFDKYPVPYLIKRGIYHNWRIIESIKNKETQILEQIIPYLLMIKKGTEALSIQKDIDYSDEQLQGINEQFKVLMEEVHELRRKNKTPIRATNFDEEIKHLIPDLETIFKPILFEQTERNILSGLGFIDIAEAVSNSRRESVLNPKAFIEETKKGVADFKNQILKQLIYQMKQKNETSTKYNNKTFYVTHSPIRAFMTDDFKQLIRVMYDRGRISSQTAVELIGEVDFETEVYRRDQERKRDIEELMYPQIIRNDEDKGMDLPPDTDEEEIPEDKKGVEKENYDMSEDLVGAPYNDIKDLPPRIKNNLTPSLQRTFLRVFNKAYNTYKNEERAFKVAWSVIKKMAKKNRNGKWVKKSSRMKLSKAILEEALESEQDEVLQELEEQTTKEVFESKKLEIAKKQSLLLDKLLNNDTK